MDRGSCTVSSPWRQGNDWGESNGNHRGNNDGTQCLSVRISHLHFFLNVFQDSVSWGAQAGGTQKSARLCHLSARITGVSHHYLVQCQLFKYLLQHCNNAKWYTMPLFHTGGN